MSEPEKDEFYFLEHWKQRRDHSGAGDMKPLIRKTFPEDHLEETISAEDVAGILDEHGLTGSPRHSLSLEELDRITGDLPDELPLRTHRRDYGFRSIVQGTFHEPGKYPSGDKAIFSFELFASKSHKPIAVQAPKHEDSIGRIVNEDDAQTAIDMVGRLDPDDDPVERTLIGALTPLSSVVLSSSRSLFDSIGHDSLSPSSERVTLPAGRLSFVIDAEIGDFEQYSETHAIQSVLDYLSQRPAGPSR